MSLLKLLDQVAELSQAADHSGRKLRRAKEAGEAILCRGFMLRDKISKNVGLAKSLAAKSEEGKKVGTLGLAFEVGKNLLR